MLSQVPHVREEENTMKQRHWKTWTLAATAVIAGFALTFLWPVYSGLDADLDSSPRAQAAKRAVPYDLTRLQVLNRVIVETKGRYVDPERVVPKRMFLSGLNAVQQHVAPVLVHYETGQSDLTVQVGAAKQAFAVSDVTSPWALTARFREVFAFLQKHLAEEDVELRTIEYAAVNGMLRSLDPHSVLLTPEVFDEMQMSTRGEFGGLGIVISIREAQLTVIKPMAGTPAARAGLQRGDHIVKIDTEGTLNMPLSEAVDRLRGRPGSAVTLMISRRRGNKWSEPFSVRLTRAVIHIDSVEHKTLGNGVGLIRVKSFQGNTHSDLKRALAALKQQGLKSLVLDLRDNPGGLLDQAVKITDLFLESGTIVTTSSSDPSQREQKFASATSTEAKVPMVVLVNGSSASASEIVAGALRNHDRALVIGERTFGKGSVQVLYNLNDGSALKLTVAQYLTPGDVSIQGVGVAPDIAVEPMTVDRQELDLSVNKHSIRESDLLAHLENTRALLDDGALLTVRYYLAKEVRNRLRSALPDDREENEEEDEFLMRFSRTLLSQAATHADRNALLELAKPVVEAVSQDELKSAISELKKLGVDWTTGPNEGPAAFRVVTELLPSVERAEAGQPLELKVTVTNTGDQPVYRLQATTESQFDLFDQRELVFGRLRPGESKTWVAPLGACFRRRASGAEVQSGCPLPPELPARADGIKVVFSELYGRVPDTKEVRTQLRALPKPNFAFAAHVADDIQGNGDGALQPGEYATLYVRVKNSGLGPAAAPEANIRNLSGPGIMLHRGRFQLDPIAPQQDALVAFTFEVLEDFNGDDVGLELFLTDDELGVTLREKLAFPVVPASTVAARNTKLLVRKGARLLAQPDTASDLIAEIITAGALRSDAELGGYHRVVLDKGQPAWVSASDIAQGETSAAADVEYTFAHTPPIISITSEQSLVATRDSIELSGSLYDEQGLRDMYIFVGARKVYYKALNQPGNKESTPWSATVPLEPGVNYITLVARETAEVMTKKVLVVRRDGPDGELLETTKHGDAWLLAEWHPSSH